MSDLLTLLLLAIAAIGHAVLWVRFLAFAHSVALPRPVINSATLLTAVCAAGLPLALLGRLWARGLPLRWSGPPPLDQGWLIYLACCFLVGIWALPIWSFRRLGRAPCSVEGAWERRGLDLSQAALPAPGQPSTRLNGFLRQRWNDSLRPEVCTRELVFEHLPAALDGFRLVHLADLHFSGRIPKAYFTAAFEAVNSLAPDLIAITGDIVDRRECVAWIPETIGRLSAKHGMFYVLGNHDRRVDVVELRRVLAESGATATAGSWHTVPVGDAVLVIAGNELPWFGPATPRELPAFDGCTPLKVLLAHTPDQLGWARERGFDLMLAGHVHGGQICLPVIGPLIAPSRFGCRYAEGVYYQSPTVLHVTRGISNMIPVRWNCRPEISVLVLRSAKRITASAGKGKRERPRLLP